MSSSKSIMTENRTINIENIHSNVTPEILEISVDKLRIVLLENEKKISDANEWQTPFAILLTIIIVLCTATFKEFLSLSADSWHAIFIVGAVVTCIWFLSALFRRQKRMTISELIDRMKQQD